MPDDERDEGPAIISQISGKDYSDDDKQFEYTENDDKQDDT